MVPAPPVVMASLDRRVSLVFPEVLVLVGRVCLVLRERLEYPDSPARKESPVFPAALASLAALVSLDRRVSLASAAAVDFPDPLVPPEATDSLDLRETPVSLVDLADSDRPETLDHPDLLACLVTLVWTASLALRVSLDVALEACLDLKDPLDLPDPLVAVDSLDRRESQVFPDLAASERRVTPAVMELPVTLACPVHLDCLDHVVWTEALVSLDQRERWV